ncbi:MAG: primosomal protein N' [Deltaproteobacteria bacterium]
MRVAVCLPVKNTFHYAVPDRLVSAAKIGCRAKVPFRTQAVTGYILEAGSAELNESPKEIVDILDSEPLFHAGLVPFFEWMAEYYLFPIGRLIQSALPGGLNMTAFKTAELTNKGRDILDLLPAKSDEKAALLWVRENSGKRIPFPLQKAKAFEKKGWLALEDRTRKGRVQPLMRKTVRPRHGIALEAILEGQAGRLRAKNEQAFLEFLFSADGILLKEISGRFSNGPYLVQKWRNMGVLQVVSAPVLRDHSGEILSPSSVPQVLYDQQKRALKPIQASLRKKAFATALLHGVTGSGKTEVYYQAVEEARRLGRQTIVMVPEIALSIYMEGLFRSRLGDRVAVFHSGLSEGERYDQWMRMARGEVDLVIGARSALFAPFSNLGLIIVDEEHDLSYKQEEAPRYQARDAAVVRGKMEKAVVLLGSGTPSVQSFHNACEGKYGLLCMPDRIEKRPLPDVEVIDMKGLPAEGAKGDVISPVLKAAIDTTLKEGQQAMLFLNRRGFNRVYLCRSCGEAVRCPNCDVPLIYHRHENCLACHYCDFHTAPQAACPMCGRESLRAYGFGTERLEQVLKDHYPSIQVARMDRDTIRGKGRTFQLLRKFAHREIDVLVGTQMITKGYDFPHVTLVGVIAADSSLAFPDFRAAERTFQILSQVAGRAGRGDRKGRVIIQTFNPDHYAVTTARHHNYRAFFDRERELRAQLSYPPFSYMACLRLQGNNKQKTAEMTEKLGREMNRIIGRWPKRGKEIQVLGPVEAPLSKLRGKYRWQIFVKSKGTALRHYFLNEVERLSTKMIKGTGVQLVIDVDPYQML